MTNARTARVNRAQELAQRAEEVARKKRQRRLTIRLSALAVLVLAVASVVAWQVVDRRQATETAASGAAPANLVDGAIMVGNSTAKVTIDVYADFQCPACKAFDQANRAQLAKWAAAGTARIAYRPVALLDSKSSTQYSTRALAAAAAVVNTKLAAYEKFAQLLFDNQPAEGGAGLTDAQLVGYAAQAGADKAAVEKAVNAQTYRGWAKTATEAFSKKGYTATPTVLVNGTVLKATDAKALSEAVTKASQTATASPAASASPAATAGTK